jgi:hypothetical protein
MAGRVASLRFALSAISEQTAGFIHHARRGMYSRSSLY